MTGVNLSRQLGLGVLILYGVGDILGAGIYALVGKVAGTAGSGAWLSFAVSGLLALITGLSYAEFSARIPHSAGASAYCGAASRHAFPPFLAGMLVLTSGVTSTATVALAFHGYLAVLLPLPQIAAAVGLIALISAWNYAGIRQSAMANNVLTLIEIAGLLWVIVAVGGHAVTQRPPAELAAALVPTAGWEAILAGATLAFFAFIGFEDLANLAEEAKDPARDLPRAILIAVAVTTLLYLAVVTVVLWAMPPEQAAASPRPLLDALGASGFAMGAPLFSVIAMIAICNTGLANSIMASRLLYGMARNGLLPNFLATVHAERRTPWAGIVITALLGVLLVATGGVALMAQTTGSLLVCVFLMVHVSLIRVRRAAGTSSAGLFRAPAFVPYMGALLCTGMLTRFPAEVWARVAIVVAVAAGLHALMPKGDATRAGPAA